MANNSNLVGGMSVANGQNFDLGKWLQSLTQPVNIDPNKIPGGQQYAQDTGQTQPTLHPIAQAAEDGAVKATKEQAYQAVLQGGTDVAKHIVDQYGSGTIDPQQALNTFKSIIPQDSSSINTVNIPNKDNNFGYKPDNSVSAFFNMLGITPTPEAQVLLTQAAANRQKIAAGQPAEIAVPQAQAAEIQQKIAGAVPLQPADVVKLNVDTYGAALKANQDAYTNSNTEVANLSKTLDILQQGRSTWGKAFGGNTDIMNQIKAVIAAKTAENQKIGKNQKTLMDNAPSISGEKENKSSGFKVIGVR